MLITRQLGSFVDQGKDILAAGEWDGKCGGHDGGGLSERKGNNVIL